MHAATADFETYSEAGHEWDGARQKWVPPTNQGSGKKRGLEYVGSFNYTWHPTFRPLSLCYDLHRGNGVTRWVPPDDLQPLAVDDRHPLDLLAHVAGGGLLEAWNIDFDARVWEWCVENWGWPPLPIAQQRCTMARSKAAAYPAGLDVAASVLGTPRKDPVGEKLVRKLTQPRSPTKKNPALRWTPQIVPGEFEALYRYNEQDVRAEDAAGHRLPELTPHEFAVWQFDRKVNTRGMQIDVVAVDNCIAIVEQIMVRDNARLYQITGGLVARYTEAAAMQAWLARQGCHMPSVDEEAVTEQLAEYERRGLDLERDPVCQVLGIRQSLSFGSVKKLYSIRAKVSPAGRIYDNYNYYGAHTGMWNGRDPQMANLPRPMHSRFENPDEVERALRIISARTLELLEVEYPDMKPLEVIASMLRSLIIAGPNRRLISADFNAIQAVVTSALAGEEWRLEVFRTHGKIYEAMASRLTGVPFEEFAAYKKRTGHHHPARQNPGKLAVLSGDFGAWVNGWKRFGADKLLGSDENIKAAIMKTRNAQPAIVELWGGQTRNKFNRGPGGFYEPARNELYGLEGAAVAAIKWPGNAYEYRGIVYQMHGDTLYCRPPSGGFIRYHNARIQRSERAYADPWEVEIKYDGMNTNAKKGAYGWNTMSLYAGVLTQNVVAHESREIQALSLLRLEAAGYPIVMHTHDEGVADVPIGFGSAKEYERIVNVLPEWARTPDGKPWPIRAPDPWERMRYGKWG